MKKILQKIHAADRLFIAIVAAYIAICWVITLATGQHNRFMPMMYLGAGLQVTLSALCAYILYRLFRATFILIKHKPQRPAQFLLNDLKSGPLRPELWHRGLPVFIAFFFFFSTFTSMKFLIADIHPFEWDQFMINADRTIHLGMDPWQILHPILGHPFITHVIAFIYILWLPIFFLVLYWQLFRLKDDTLRMRFFYTFALTWAINGTFLALIFSSAGPCYFENVTGSDHYAPLMNYLRDADSHYKIWSVFTQDLLWKNHMDDGMLIGGGISAFPSVHVATVFLFVLVARHVNRLAFTLFFTFFAVIFIGSIHLGWHYAVDGYFTILTTLLLWRLTAKLPQCHPERSEGSQ